MCLSGGVDLVQGFIEDLQFLLLHLYDAAHEDRSVLLGYFGYRVVQVISEGGVDVGAKARGIDAPLLFDDVVHPGPASSFFVSAALFVGLPLLLLRVADPH